MSSRATLRNYLDRRWNAILGACTKNKWDENRTTFDVLDTTADALDGVRLDVGSDQMRIKCTFFKQKGKQETAFGDIAFLVNVMFRDASRHEGVAFLEAKKREWPGDKYAALEEEQAKRIVENARYPKALLFDHTPIPGMQTTGVPGASPAYFFDEDDTRYAALDQPSACHVCVVPLEVAATVAAGTKLSGELYRFALPFSEQLVERYLLGVDLDLRSDRVAAAKGHAKAEGIPDGLLTIQVGHGEMRLPPVEDLGVNMDIFERVRPPRS